MLCAWSSSLKLVVCLSIRFSQIYKHLVVIKLQCCELHHGHDVLNENSTIFTQNNGNFDCLKLLHPFNEKTTSLSMCAANFVWSKYNNSLLNVPNRLETFLIVYLETRTKVFINMTIKKNFEVCFQIKHREIGQQKNWMFFCHNIEHVQNIASQKHAGDFFPE